MQNVRINIKTRDPTSKSVASFGTSNPISENSDLFLTVLSHSVLISFGFAASNSCSVLLEFSLPLTHGSYQDTEQILSHQMHGKCCILTLLGLLLFLETVEWFMASIGHVTLSCVDSEFINRITWKSIFFFLWLSILLLKTLTKGIGSKLVLND